MDLVKNVILLVKHVTEQMVINVTVVSKILIELLMQKIKHVYQIQDIMKQVKSMLKNVMNTVKNVMVDGLMIVQNVIQILNYKKQLKWKIKKQHPHSTNVYL